MVSDEPGKIAFQLKVTLIYHELFLQNSPQKHVRLSPRPSTSYAPYPSPTYSTANYPVLVQQYHSMPSSQGSITKLSHSSPPQLPPPPQQQQNSMLHTPSKSINQSCGIAKIRPNIVSPGRRTRGENKKCRKVYGMDNRDSWCTQCKWKKACSRFGDWKLLNNKQQLLPLKITSVKTFCN